MKKLSVIICVYNTDGKLFEKCLKSVFNSTIKDKEVIIVDDGSTVNYSSIVNRFDVKYFKTENQGTLKARIFGVKQAMGSHICFVDSDDIISFNYLAASMIEIKDADIILNDWAFNTQGSKYFCGNDSSITTNFVENIPLNKFFASNGTEHSYQVLWNKIFKKEVLVSAFEEILKLSLAELSYAEDILISYFTYKNSKQVINTHLGYYFYTIHNNQQINVQNKNKLLNHINSASCVFNIIEDDLKINNNFEKYQTNFYKWKQLICSLMVVNAKKLKLKGIDNLIIQKFNGCKLKKSMRKGDYAYFNHKLLPNNIAEIDSVLEKIYFSNKVLKVYAKKGGYAYKTLSKMKEMFYLKFKFASKKEADIIMPKEQISFKQKVLHNNLICKIGMFLFPKGSKIRSILKKKL